MSREWIIIRGLGREAEHSKEFVELLKKTDAGAQVRCVDLPGAGQFHKLSSPMSIDSIAEFLAIELKKVPVEERYILSVSLGAMVVTALLKKYPELATGAILINSSYANLSPFYHRMQVEALVHIYRATTATSLHERERAVLDMVSNRSDRHLFIESWENIARLRPVSPLNFLKQLVAAATYSVSPSPPTVPVLVLVSAQDRMVNPECSKKLAEFWNVPLETHPTTGHEMWLDDGKWVLERAIDFFKIKI
jgi:pimeloyl-ACP methyl ester carboxylesterase